MPKLAFIANGSTDIGRVRSTNQDAFYIDHDQQVFIVADGMGGHAGGEIASSLAIEKIKEFLQSHPQVNHQKDGQINVDLAAAVNFASTSIYEKALENPDLKGMGTTVTLLKIIGSKGYCAHVGDSRLYLIRQGFIYQISHDHSLVNEQVRAGLMTKEEAETHHLKNVITRSVGYQEEEDVDTTSFVLEPDDLMLLCSDGLHGKITDSELAHHILESGPEAILPLITLANERGGEDNITAIVIKIQSSGDHHSQASHHTNKGDL